MLARRSQYHQSRLVEHLSPYDGHFMATVKTLSHRFVASGMDTVSATQRAYAVIGDMVARQASLLSYIDNFFVLGMAALCLVPFAFLMKKVKPGGAIAVH